MRGFLTRVSSAAKEGRLLSSVRARILKKLVSPARERRYRATLNQRYVRTDPLPSISLRGDFSRSRESALLKACFDKAQKGESCLPKSIRGIRGMSGQKYRSFVNNLIAEYPNPRYLEVGSWAGSTVTAALYGNRAYAVCIDNWSQFGGPRSEFFANIEKVASETTHLRVIEQDFRSVNFHELAPFNVYLFDGPHAELDQYDGVMIAQPALTDRFVLIVDDWNWREVRVGTLRGLIDAKCRIESSIELRTTHDESHAPVTGERSDWHNGYFLAVICK